MTNAHVLPVPVYPVIVGRYALFDPIASGGMASVHIGRLLGSYGFARTVAIKRLHQDMALNPDFLAMFLDEARLAARVHHTNVVQTLDVVALHDELLLVMEYISGAALSKILAVDRKAHRLTPHRVAVDIMVGVLNGLHAAHEAKDESGEPLHIVHRDVSPQNILIGTDGVARLLDFGIAKAVGAAHFTRPNQIKGKIRYLSPESITGQAVTRASDIYSVSVVLWEMLAGRRLFDGVNGIDVVRQIIDAKLPAPSSVRPHISRKLDEIVMRGLDRNPAFRYATAQDMALALEAAVIPVNRSTVSQWMFANVGDGIRERDLRVAQIEREAQGEGVAAAQRLQSGYALSAEAPVDKRTLHPSSESCSAPSVSLEGTVPILPVLPRQMMSSARPRRNWQPGWLIGLPVGLLLAAGGSWWHRHERQREARPALAALAANVPKPPATAAQLVERQPLASESAGLLDSDTPALLKPKPALARKVRHPVRSAPKTATLSDRIYRRD
jgi:serine/threonine protein kinase